MHSIASMFVYQDILSSSTKFGVFWVDSHNGDFFTFSFGMYIQVNSATVQSNGSCFIAF